MTRRLIVVFLILSLTVLCKACLADSKERAGMPHTIWLRLEPESLEIDTPIRIALTFVPCVDIDSLTLRLYLPKQPGAQVQGPITQEWVGSVKKGREINLSGEVVFRRRGLYSVEVFYVHPDPQFRDPLNPRWDTKIFRILVPGGIDTTNTEGQSPIRYKVRPFMGGRGALSDTLQIPTPQMLRPVVPESPCLGWILSDTAKLRCPRL